MFRSIFTHAGLGSKKVSNTSTSLDHNANQEVNDVPMDCCVEDNEVACCSKSLNISTNGNQQQEQAPPAGVNDEVSLQRRY